MEVDGVRCTMYFPAQNAKRPDRVQLSTAECDSGLTLRASTAFGRLVTGDDLCDCEMSLQGDDAVIMAVATPANRSLLVDLARGPAKLTNGAVTFSCSREDIVERAAWAVGVHKALTPPDDIASALRDRALNDPVPGVRARALAILRKRYPEHATARMATDMEGGVTVAEVEDGNVTLADEGNLSLEPE